MANTDHSAIHHYPLDIQVSNTTDTYVYHIYEYIHIGSLMPNCSNSIAKALELL